jgi:hypothetical protein
MNREDWEKLLKKARATTQGCRANDGDDDDDGFNILERRTKSKIIVFNCMSTLV